MSLYLKYRPKTIDELDLAGVRKTLTGVISSVNLSHAYLFTGPRGAGKTSAARILARIVNCEKNGTALGEPCNMCAACVSILSGSAVDVIEIDAASNRGIDDIRELKERIKLSPALLRKKVYIIDEVHMLTTEAFNALLKTLEEPPQHALFILCTTESHKVPETISSRCVRVSFTKATTEEMKRSFARVVSGEKARIDERALDAIARAVDGSFRDGVKILDTALALGKAITLPDVEVILYGASGFQSTDLSHALLAKDVERALKSFHGALSEGVDLMHLLVSVMKDLRDEIISAHDITLVPLVYALDEVARKVALSPLPHVLVEVAIVEWCVSSEKHLNSSSSLPPTKGGSSEHTSSSRAQPSSAATKKEMSSSLSKPSTANVAVHEVPVTVLSDTPPGIALNAEEAWNKLIANLNGDSYSLGALLSKARPGTIKGNLLTIEMSHDFHREQLMHEKFRSRVEKLMSDVVGQPMRVECIVVRENKLQTPQQVDTIAEVNPDDNELLSAAEEIFST